MIAIKEIFRCAQQAGIGIPAFNIPYLPMVQPVVQAVADLDSFALVEVARLEWVKLESRSPAAVQEEFARWQDLDHVRLHLDHVPVLDEGGQLVDYLSILREAIGLGYHSVMVDGSRLGLEENIAASRQAAELAHAAGIPIEAELGAVMGHEAGPLLPYEQMFASRQGFTKPEEARRFVQETGCDWLSVAIGTFHGAFNVPKSEARLDLALLDELREAAGVPLVLHGGSSVRLEHLLAAFGRGIVKINIGAEIRGCYQQTLREGGSVPAAQAAVYERVTRMVRDEFGWAGSAARLARPAPVVRGAN